MVDDFYRNLITAWWFAGFPEKSPKNGYWGSS